jgi:hypothetical protein
MKEGEMGRIAELIADCIQKGKEVRPAVNEFRRGFAEVHYSFDQLLVDLESPNFPEPVA